MKIITLTQSTAADGAPPPPLGKIAIIHDEPVPGFFRKFKVQSDAIILEHGDQAVTIPLAELWRVAERHEPALRPPVLIPAANPAPKH